MYKYLLTVVMFFPSVAAAQCVNCGTSYFQPQQSVQYQPTQYVRSYAVGVTVPNERVIANLDEPTRTRQDIYVTLPRGERILVPIINGYQPQVRVRTLDNGRLVHVMDYHQKQVWNGTTTFRERSVATAATAVSTDRPVRPVEEPAVDFTRSSLPESSEPKPATFLDHSPAPVSASPFKVLPSDIE